VVKKQKIQKKLHGERGNFGEYSSNLASTKFTFSILINYLVGKYRPRPPDYDNHTHWKQ
jgi:hypothetical protein